MNLRSTTESRTSKSHFKAKIVVIFFWSCKVIFCQVAKYKIKGGDIKKMMKAHKQLLLEFFRFFPKNVTE